MAPISVEYCRMLVRYTYWARDVQIQACSTLTEEQFTRPMGSSFSSVRDTLVHLATVEWVWLERWLGRSPAAMWKPENFSTLESIRARWQEVEAAVRDFVAALAQERLDSAVTYTNFRGEQWTYPLWMLIAHLANHQSYHRGQITTLLRQHGLSAPMVDLLIAGDVGVL
jgi:uncharacterized damage-inducible protein DinB